MLSEMMFEQELSTYVRIPYLLYRPENIQPDEQLPMVVFLHGAGERGEGLHCVKGVGLPKLLEQNQFRRCFVLCPHCIGEEIWNNRAYQIKALIDTVAREYPVDVDRISITGLSMGGYGTWEMGMSFPECFSAIAPICGGGMPWRAYRLKNVPVWAFHGDKDNVVDPSNSQEMVDAILRGGGNARLTTLESAGHDSWTYAYEQTDLIDWLLEQKRINS